MGDNPSVDKDEPKPESEPTDERAAADKKADTAGKAPPPMATSRAGRFIQTYHTFLSTTVVGAAGLIATSIWQYRQSEIARRQSESQQQIAKTQADNQWRIERAEILSKNLQVLASRGNNSAEQRYGVLLSLTRGAILDPELAVSYALELGRDNPDYMKSVLASTSDKDYLQLAHAFTYTCEQRYGLTRQIAACKPDELGARSDAIAELIYDDVEQWAATPPVSAAAAAAALAHSPLGVLTDERRVQKELTRLVWLFTPTLLQLYQRNQWTELGRFESAAPGAHLLAALVVATAHTGELGRAGGADGAKQLHASERAWLAGYAFGHTCDEDCRSRITDYMLTGLVDAQADFDDLLRRVLERTPGDAAAAMERLHTRLLRCQVDAPVVEALRDRVLVPLARDVLDKKPPASRPAAPGAGAAASPGPPGLDNAIDLLALVPDPTDPAALGAWNDVLAKLHKVYPERRKAFDERRASALAQERAPPPALKKVSFCRAADVEPASDSDRTQ
jgi:hypothetical protein